MPAKVTYDFNGTRCSQALLNDSLEKTAALSRSYTSILKNDTYDQPESFLHAPFDIDGIALVQSLARSCLNLKPRYLVLIGIGGSSLGARAVYDALKPQGIPVLFADTIDTAYLLEIYSLIESALGNNQSVILNVISKSGSTIETLVNFQLFLELLKKYHPTNYQRYCVVTSDDDSWLYRFGQSEKMQVLTIPKQVGGRFSIFTAAGLFPLGMAGVALPDLVKGAKEASTEVIENGSSIPLEAASTLFYHYQQGIRINDMFLFAVALESLGKWCRQLMGESIGKSYTDEGVYKPQGITPTVSMGTNDLHAVAQLYLAGPIDRVTTFVVVDKLSEKELILPKISGLEHSLAYAPGRSVSSFMHAIEGGVQRAYSKRELPFYAIKIPSLKADYLGYMMQMQMMIVVYLGRLMRLNPFDQPAVETYKQEARALLHETH